MIGYLFCVGLGHYEFIDLPEGVETLNAELIVHRCRTFDFLVAPPKIEPAPAATSTRAPRSAAQRLENARRAIDAGQQSLASGEPSAGMLNNLAWVLATTEDEARRDGPRALALIRPLAAVEGGWQPVVAGCRRWRGGR